MASAPAQGALRTHANFALGDGGHVGAGAVVPAGDVLVCERGSPVVAWRRHESSQPHVFVPVIVPTSATTSPERTSEAAPLHSVPVTRTGFSCGAWNNPVSSHVTFGDVAFTVATASTRRPTGAGCGSAREHATADATTSTTAEEGVSRKCMRDGLARFAPRHRARWQAS